MSPIRCRHVVAYTSAVTGRRQSCGYPSKALADADADALRREGARDVIVYPHREGK